jgi:hypothetical protein
MNNWLHGDEDINNIENFPKDTYGFVYMITHIPTDKCYIGKKVLYNNIKKKFELRDDKHDFFVDRAVEENKEQRVEYLSILKAMNEFKKPKSRQGPPFWWF